MARAALALAGATAALAAVPADLVTSLPGFGAPLSTTYSGACFWAPGGFATAPSVVCASSGFEVSCTGPPLRV